MKIATVTPDYITRGSGAENGTLPSPKPLEASEQLKPDFDLGVESARLAITGFFKNAVVIPMGGESI